LPLGKSKGQFFKPVILLQVLIKTELAKTDYAKVKRQIGTPPQKHLSGDLQNFPLTTNEAQLSGDRLLFIK
jgi:hypothetical protein